MLAVPPVPVEKDEVRSQHSVGRFLADSEELLNRGSSTALLLGIKGRNAELCDRN
jgi:hypothetical protein